MGWEAGLAIDVMLLVLFSLPLAIGVGAVYLLVRLAKKILRAAFGRWGRVSPMQVGSRVRYRNTDRIGSVVAISSTNRRYRVDFDTYGAWLPLDQLARVSDGEDREG